MDDNPVSGPAGPSAPKQPQMRTSTSLIPITQTGRDTSDDLISQCELSLLDAQVVLFLFDTKIKIYNYRHFLVIGRLQGRRAEARELLESF